MISWSKHHSTHKLRSCWRVLLISWFLLFMPVSVSSTPAMLSVAGFSPYKYACEISDYGNRLTEDTEYRALLLKSPGDAQLCVLPPLPSNVDSEISPPIELGSPPLALLVSMGGCDVYTKTEIALKLHEMASRSLKFIIFYNNDAESSDGIVSILPPRADSGVDVPENITKLAFLSISTSAGVSLMGFLQHYSEATGANPEFLAEGYKGWDLTIIVKLPLSIPNNTLPPNSYESNTTEVHGGNFFWFRLILFALLIASPCCRALIMWWNGGGRIHFRRNENGRIAGLQYVAPVSYWYASNGVQNSNVPISDCLTEGQVLALPEITFKIQDEDGSPNDEGEDDPLDERGQIDDVDIVVSSGSADENDENLRQAEATLNRAGDVNESVRSDEEQVVGACLITSCTTCSICIEEFEPGERIRLLPRCKHAFHTLCIMPWLTERQGCCPLCKKSVIAAGHNLGGDNREITTDVEPISSQEENQTEQGSIGAVSSTEVQTTSSTELQTSSVPTENSDMAIHTSNSVSPVQLHAEEDNETTGTGRTSESIQE